MQASEAALAAESIIDILSNYGGLHLYDKYLQTKDNPHCAFSFFPGDPGEADEDFDDNWIGDQEPIEAEIDHWATKIVKTKQVIKVENQNDDAISSARSRRAPSVASSRKTFKMRKMQVGIKDSEQKSKLGDSTRERSERKDNQINISSNTITQNTNNQLILIPLEVEPPRVISDEEKILRDRKEKQLKMKEHEMEEQREKEEREKLRMRSKQDAFAEIEKSDYTYDHNGKILMVKKPNLQKIPGNQQITPDIQFNGNNTTSSQQKTQQLPIKSRTRLMSAKQAVQKEVKIQKDSRKEDSIIQEVKLTIIYNMQKAEQELKENYENLFNQQAESLKEYGIQNEPFEVQAGIVMTDKEGRKLKGPNINRDNQMTLLEYQKVAAQFEVMNDEKLSRYGSAKKVQSQENMVSQLNDIEEDDESLDMPNKRKSQERILKNLGADEVYDREISYDQYKINLKAKRKDLKSANVKNLNDNVLAKHNNNVRITSAKQQQDVRIRRTPSKLGLKERIFNYENHIGGIDFSQNMYGSQISDGRPQSSHPSNKKSQKIVGKVSATSLIDEYNKKLVEKGTTNNILPQEMPQASQYLVKKQERPQTSKPIIHQKNKITNFDSQVGLGFHQQSILGRNSVISGNTESVGFLNTKSLLQKKAPRERIISAKLPKDHEKLPPPPFGKTMGHGLMMKQYK